MGYEADDEFNLAGDADQPPEEQPGAPLDGETAAAESSSEAGPSDAPDLEPAAEAFEAAPSGETSEDGRNWFVIHCYSGYENKVRHNLEQRIDSMGMKGKIFDVVVPTEEEI